LILDDYIKMKLDSSFPSRRILLGGNPLLVGKFLITNRTKPWKLPEELIKEYLSKGSGYIDYKTGELHDKVDDYFEIVISDYDKIKDEYSFETKDFIFTSSMIDFNDLDTDKLEEWLTKKYQPEIQFLRCESKYEASLYSLFRHMRCDTWGMGNCYLETYGSEMFSTNLYHRRNSRADISSNDYLRFSEFIDDLSKHLRHLRETGKYIKCNNPSELLICVIELLEINATSKINCNLESLKKEYREKCDTLGGIVVNTDLSEITAPNCTSNEIDFSSVFKENL